MNGMMFVRMLLMLAAGFLLASGVEAGSKLPPRGVAPGDPHLQRATAPADQSAKIFLTRIYAVYKGKKGIPLDSHRAYLRYFTPELAALIEADANEAAKRNEVPSMNGDPFIDAQDWEIKSFAIDVKDLAPDKALGVVKFKNMGEDKTVQLDLVRLREGWRIYEIHMPSGSLRGLFKKQ